MITKIYLTYIMLFMLLLLGCKEKEVTITKDYVINPYWDEVDNSFTITKMILKNSSDSINLKTASPAELLKKLTDDTSFTFIANVKYNGDSYAKRKVYFNTANGFSWGSLNNRNSNYEQKILGGLQRNTWYCLGGLDEEKTLYYLFLDTLSNLHTFKVGAQYWTNY